jgi:hypothetical protein
MLRMKAGFSFQLCCGRDIYSIACLLPFVIISPAPPSFAVVFFHIVKRLFFTRGCNRAMAFL